MKRRLSNSSNSSDSPINSNNKRRKTLEMDNKYDVTSVILIQKFARRYLAKRELIRNVFKDTWNHLDYHEGKFVKLILIFLLRSLKFTMLHSILVI